MGDHSEGEGTVTAVARAVHIVKAVAETPHGASLAEISARVGLAKTTTRRLLITLTAVGVLRQVDGSGHYCLGSQLLELGERARAQLFSGISVQSVLAKLSGQAQETVHLATPDGYELVYLEKVESSRSLTIRSRIGAQVMLHSSGLGKAYLAFQEPDKIESYLATIRLEAKTDTTITDAGLFRAELAEIRRRGYAIDNGENEEGVRCIGAPVLNQDGIAIAAISITGPSTRMPASRVKELVPLLLASAQSIASELRSEVNVFSAASGGNPGNAEAAGGKAPVREGLLEGAS